MKKNGFISTSLIYTFFIIFLTLLVFVISSYSKTRFLLNEYKDKIKEEFSDINTLDVNLYFKVWNEETKEYEIEYNMPKEGYVFDNNLSYCEKGSTLSMEDGRVIVDTIKKDRCYAYFNLDH